MVWPLCILHKLTLFILPFLYCSCITLLSILWSDALPFSIFKTLYPFLYHFAYFMIFICRTEVKWELPEWVQFSCIMLSLRHILHLHSVYHNYNLIFIGAVIRLMAISCILLGLGCTSCFLLCLQHSVLYLVQILRIWKQELGYCRAGFLYRLAEFQNTSGRNLLRIESETWEESCFVMQWNKKDSLLCIADWLYKCSVQKLVVVISNIESGEVLERWQFDIECDKTAKDDR